MSIADRILWMYRSYDKMELSLDDDDNVEKLLWGGKEMKRNSRQWIGILLYMLIGASSGILFLRFLEQHKDEEWSIVNILLLFGVVVVVLYGSITIQIIIHEAGHMIFGHAAGYRFNSFRIFGWMWLKKDGKLQLKHLSLAGTGGQCLMAPPELRDGKMPVLLYNFGGAIMNLIASAVFVGLSFLFPVSSIFNSVFLILAVVGVGFAIVVPEDEAMKNSIIASVGVLACSRLMDEHRFAEADELMERLLSIESGIVGLHKSLMMCDRIYVELITQNRTEILDSMMTKEQKKIMKAMSKYPTVLRTEYVYALLADRDKAKAREIEAKFERNAAGYPYPSEIEGEKEMMKIAEELAAGDGE